ncbi:MAG: hypothetical protein AAGG51_27700 [Cyanobacteria bacterium P01_G01_bin.54]
MAENTVLLLEDDPAVRDELKTLLPGGKFKLLEVSDSKTALDVIKREVETLRLMVIKFKMPKIPGWKLVKKAQEQPKLQGIPMVLVASATDTVAKAFPEPPEFFEIVQYPCDRPTMQAAVKAAMAKAKRPRTGAAVPAKTAAPPPPPAAKKKAAAPPPPPAAKKKAAAPPPPPAAKKKVAAPPPPPAAKKKVAAPPPPVQPAAKKVPSPAPAPPKVAAQRPAPTQPKAKPPAKPTAKPVFDPVPYQGGDPFAVGDRQPATPAPGWQSDDPFAAAIAAGGISQAASPAPAASGVDALNPFAGPAPSSTGAADPFAADANDPFVGEYVPDPFDAAPGEAADPFAADANNPFVGEYVPDPFDAAPGEVDDQDPFAASANFKSPPAMPPPMPPTPATADPLELDPDWQEAEDDPLAGAVASLESIPNDPDPLAGAIAALDEPLLGSTDVEDDDPFGGAVMSLDELADEPDDEPNDALGSVESPITNAVTDTPVTPIADSSPTPDAAAPATAAPIPENWDIPYAEFECLHQYSEARDRGITGMAIGPEGALYTCGPELYICRWYFYELTKEQQFDLYSKGCDCLALSPDGQVLLTGAEQSNIKLWNAPDGTLLDTLSDHSLGVNGLVLSPDGQTVVTSAARSNLKLWDYMTGELQGPLNDESFGVTAVAITPDGQIVLTSSRQSNIRFWDWATGELLGPLNIQSLGVTSLVVSPDGQAVISGDEQGMLTITSLATGEPIRTLKAHDQPIAAVAVSPDGWYIVTASPLEMKLWGCWPEEA